MTCNSRNLQKFRPQKFNFHRLNPVPSMSHLHNSTLQQTHEAMYTVQCTCITPRNATKGGCLDPKTGGMSRQGGCLDPKTGGMSGSQDRGDCWIPRQGGCLDPKTGGMSGSQDRGMSGSQYRGDVWIPIQGGMSGSQTGGDCWIPRHYTAVHTVHYINFPLTATVPCSCYGIHIPCSCCTVSLHCGGVTGRSCANALWQHTTTPPNRASKVSSP